MIVVIADDITGAAELAGIALRYGLRVSLSNEIKKSEGFDVLCLYTNTRSVQKNDAVAMMKEVTQKSGQPGSIAYLQKNRFGFAWSCAC